MYFNKGHTYRCTYNFKKDAYRQVCDTVDRVVGLETEKSEFNSGLGDLLAV